MILTALEMQGFKSFPKRRLLLSARVSRQLSAPTEAVRVISQTLCVGYLVNSQPRAFAAQRWKTLSLTVPRSEKLTDLLR